MSTISDLFLANGKLLSVEGNQILTLENPDCIWMVSLGSVDVFAVPHDADGTPGARIHLCRVKTGELICSCDIKSESLPKLIAVGLPGSEVVQVENAQLDELLDQTQSESESSSRDELATKVESWMNRLTSTVLHHRIPHDAIFLNIGTTQTLKSGKTYSPLERVAWIIHTDHEVEFIGHVDIPTDFSAGAFPVSDASWISANKTTKLTTVTTEEILGEARFWNGMQRFHHQILKGIVENIQLAAIADTQRLADKSKVERKLTRQALNRLAAAVTIDNTSVISTDADPLLTACQLVGKYHNITITAPDNYSEQNWNDPIEVIARASSVHIRRVALSDEWWERDNGPLLGFLTENNQAVALLPVSNSQYDLVDTVTGKKITVTANVARSLQPFGYTFYRSFAPKSLSVWDIFKFGLRGTRQDWIVLSILGIASGLIGLLIPLATGRIIGNIIPAVDQQRLLLIIIALTVSAVVAVLFQFIQGVAMLRIETRMDQAIEAAVWDRLLNLPAWFFRGYTSGDLAMRAMGISYIRQALTQSASSSLLTFFTSLIYFGLLFYYDSSLAMLAAGFFLVIVLVTGLSVYFQLPHERDQQHFRGQVWGIVLQLFTGISRLRVAGAEERALAYWANHYSRQTRSTIRSQLVSNNLDSFISTLPILAPLAIFASISFFPSENLSVAKFIAFYAAFTVIIMSAINMSGTISTVLIIVPLFERAKLILETKPEFDRNKRTPGQITGEIEISHVSFRYSDDSPLILNDVSLHIQPGEYVAFVGPSGAGKSTILRLLLGFETPEIGSIYFDREDLAGLDQLAVRRQMGVVLQDGKLMPGDILSNITGSSSLTLEDAWEAARMSGFDEDIKQMPMGMYTFLSDGESTLSGGQRQRLMIARAIVKKPKILLFDEATSALDNVTQATVSKSLDNLKATRVVIAHRLSTVINADRIFVINKGNIEQQGSYQELVEQEGLFADLVKRQLL